MGPAASPLDAVADMNRSITAPNRFMNALQAEDLAVNWKNGFIADLQASATELQSKQLHIDGSAPAVRILADNSD